MEKIESKKENYNYQERKEGYFRVIDFERVNFLLEKISQNLGIDFTKMPVEIVGPGDLLFDFQEVQTKLYKHLGGWNEYQNFLKKHSFITPLPFSRETTQRLREIAKKEGVKLDGSFEGFVYNLGGLKIMYTDIPDGKIMEMAEKYLKKEKDKIEIKSKEEAKEYLKYLAEKYLSHEIGHTVYLLLLTDKIRDEWNSYVSLNTELQKEIIEIQKDKHPNIESIPIANEAFAELFSEIANGEETKGRTSQKYPRAKELIKKILLQIKSVAEN